MSIKINLEIERDIDPDILARYMFKAHVSTDSKWGMHFQDEYNLSVEEFLEYEHAYDDIKNYLREKEK